MINNNLTSNQSIHLDQPQQLSPYKNLEDSPLTKESLPPSSHKLSLQAHNKLTITEPNDFNKRLEQIKKKYSSPSRTSRPSNASTLADLSLPPRKSAIINENILLLRKQYTPSKIPRRPLVENNTSLNSITQVREPLKNLDLGTQQQPKQVSLPYQKKTSEDQRIHSIDRLNQRIRNALGDANLKQYKPKGEQPEKVQVLKVSARPEKTEEKVSLVTNPNQEISSKSAWMNRSYMEPSSNRREKKSLGVEFENRMNEIQKRIKKSEENRLRLMENYKNSQMGEKLETHNVSINSSIKEEPAKKGEPHRRQRSITGMFTYRYGDHNRNLSKNLFDELKSATRPSTLPSQETQRSEAVQPVQKTEIKKLVNTLVEQIKLDEDFRNSKIWLEALKDPSKWSKLKEIVSKKENKHYTESEIKSLFKCTQDDQNPFYSQEQGESPEGVVNKYYSAQQHWKVKICHQFDLKKLSEQSFKQELLDLECKGYLQIEDIVRYINIETGKFYRNRDVAAIYKRITRTHILSFPDFLKLIQRL